MSDDQAMGSDLGADPDEQSTELVAIKLLSPTEAIAFGSPDALDVLGRRSRPIPSNFTNAARHLAAAAPELQAGARMMSGRWVKLTRESVEALATHGGTAAPGGGIYGLVRYADGSVAKHLTFVNPGQLSQIAATLPSLAGAVAMQLQQANIERKLEEIKQDLGYVIDHLHDEVLADLSANLIVLEDAYRATQRNEGLDDDHWQMVANLAQPVRQLHELTSQRLEALRSTLNDPDAGLSQRASKLNRALRRDRTLFWLEAHVHAELALMRWQVLYLLRQTEQHPETISELIDELEAERTQRHRKLQQLANDIARYLQGGSRAETLLEKLRIISRFRLDRLLTELEELLGIYRHELGQLGVEQRALPPGDQPPMALPSGDDDADHQWRALLDQLGRAPQAAAGLATSASRIPARVRVWRRDERPSSGQSGT